MADVDLDLEFLISLIESRPMIWDKSNDLYKDRNATRDAWNEVFSELSSDFEQMDDSEQSNYGRIVMKKWANIRDSFKKYLKKQRGTSARLKPYIYHTQLQFIAKLFPDRQRDTNSPIVDVGELETADEETSQSINEIEYKITKRQPFQKRKLVNNDLALTDKGDRHLSFFNGIIPSLNLLNDDEVVEFQMGVLQTISSIKQRRKMLPGDPLANEVTTSGSQNSSMIAGSAGQLHSYVKAESSSDSDF